MRFDETPWALRSAQRSVSRNQFQSRWIPSPLWLQGSSVHECCRASRARAAPKLPDSKNSYSELSSAESAPPERRCLRAAPVAVARAAETVLTDERGPAESARLLPQLQDFDWSRRQCVHQP